MFLGWTGGTSLCPEYPIGLHRSAPHGGKWYYLVHEPQEMRLLEREAYHPPVTVEEKILLWTPQFKHNSWACVWRKHVVIGGVRVHGQRVEPQLCCCVCSLGEVASLLRPHIPHLRDQANRLPTQERPERNLRIWYGEDCERQRRS